MELGRRALLMGMSLEYAEGLMRHKQSIFEDFQALIPVLDQAFADHTIVVRPHPAENPEIYHRIAERCRRVQVTNEGNVVPWLIAAKALIHNGCTTGVEAYALDLPTISYRASIDENYDHAFHRLPNQLSHECYDLEQLQAKLATILDGDPCNANGDKSKRIMAHHLAAMEGPLACDRIVDLFEELDGSFEEEKVPSLKERYKNWRWSIRRRINKIFRGYSEDMSHNKSDFLRHRYPGISKKEIKAKLDSFQRAFDSDADLKIETIYRKFYRISRK
jgi:hypothetical protein